MLLMLHRFSFGIKALNELKTETFCFILCVDVAFSAGYFNEVSV